MGVLAYLAAAGVLALGAQAKPVAPISKELAPAGIKSGPNAIKLANGVTVNMFSDSSCNTQVSLPTGTASEAAGNAGSVLLPVVPGLQPVAAQTPSRASRIQVHLVIFQFA